jgi:hypothetical protein
VASSHAETYRSNDSDLADSFGRGVGYVGYGLNGRVKMSMTTNATVKNNPFDDMDEPLTPAQLLVARRNIKAINKYWNDLLEKRIQYIVELKKLNKLEQK